MANDPTVAEDLTAGDRIGRLRKQLDNAHEIIAQREEEIRWLRERVDESPDYHIDDDDPDPDRAKWKRRIRRAVDKETKRMQKILDVELETLEARHAVATEQAETKHHHELETMKEQHSKEMDDFAKQLTTLKGQHTRAMNKAKKDHEAAMEESAKRHEAAIEELTTAHSEQARSFQASLDAAEQRIDDLEDEVAHWRSELHHSKAQLQAVIEHAAADVAEAELHGRVRSRAGKRREQAAWAMPKDEREALLRDAEDTLWEPKEPRNRQKAAAKKAAKKPVAKKATRKAKDDELSESSVRL